MFDDQPRLFGETFELRPLGVIDFDGLYTAACDPLTWAGHPAKDRFKREVFETYFDFLLEAGGTLIILERTTEKIIGCSRYYVSPDVPDMISIGFTFINNTYWGGDVNRQIKTLMLEHAFKTFDEVWFHIDPTNIRSQKATAKLGAKCIADRKLNLAGNPADWKCWRLRKEDWLAA